MIVGNLGKLGLVGRAAGVFVCGVLVGCMDHASRVEPKNVSSIAQKASSHFFVDKAGSYRVALFFMEGYGGGTSISEIRLEEGASGQCFEGGVPLPIHLRVSRNEKIFFDEKITSRTVCLGRMFNDEHAHVYAAIRLADVLELTPGHYGIDVSGFVGVDKL